MPIFITKCLKDESNLGNFLTLKSRVLIMLRQDFNAFGVVEFATVVHRANLNRIVRLVTNTSIASKYIHSGA